MMELDSDGKLIVIKNEFGGYFYATPSGKNSSTDKQAFHLKFNDIPSEACIELASHDWTNLGRTVVGIEKCAGCDGHCGCSNKYFLTPMNIDEAVDACSTSFSLRIDVDPSSTYWQNLLNPS